ncbi:uncharacterized protein LOC114305148 [Camellia sinensis]|uniref:uncharacterized protein LOC114305148 n=1 Tax=Camellia sinensis TaxID=4442 RepID=UPI001036EB4C|nr:uncharacterized protein LOC114305148 [Camellia sinensis]
MALAKKLNIPDDSPLRKAKAIPLPFPPLSPPSQAEEKSESESDAEDEDKDDGDALDEEVIKEATPEQASSDVPLVKKNLDEMLAEIDAEIEAEKIAEEVPPESSEVPAPPAVNAEES